MGATHLGQDAIGVLSERASAATEMRTTPGTLPKAGLPGARALGKLPKADSQRERTAETLPKAGSLQGCPKEETLPKAGQLLRARRAVDKDVAKAKAEESIRVSTTQTLPKAGRVERPAMQALDEVLGVGATEPRGSRCIIRGLVKG